MRSIGYSLLLTGIIGIMALGIAGRFSLPAALGIHVGLVVLILAFWIYKVGSFAAWWREPGGPIYSVHPSIVTLAGLGFVAAGVAIMVFGEPSDGPEAMSPGAIIYFGMIFVFLGSGLGTCAVMDWIEDKPKKPAEPKTGDDSPVTGGG